MTTRLPGSDSSARRGRIIWVSVSIAAVLLIVAALLFRARSTPPPETGKPGQAEIVRTLPPVVSDNTVSTPNVETPAPFVSLRIEQNLAMTFVLVPAGSFMMGSPEGEAGRLKDETLHRVTVTKPFYMSQTEVTARQWFRVLGTGGGIYGKGSRPQGYVKAWELDVFCGRLSAITGCTVRVPTEAEWEYACRAGTATACHWGDDIAAPRPLAWSGGRTTPVPVAQFPPNAWGLYDMHGNVAELCSDTYSPYPADPQTDPLHLEPDCGPIYRGGSYATPWTSCRSAMRRSVPIDYNQRGARMVMGIPDARRLALTPIPRLPRSEAEALVLLKKHLDGGGMPNDAVGPYRTWLDFAAVNGYLKLAEALLSIHALEAGRAYDPKQPGSRGPWTPLHSAALRGHLAMVWLLLKNEALIDGVDELGRTPLTYAFEAGHEDVARFLIEQNASCLASDEYRTTVLCFAIRAARFDLVKTVLDKGATADLNSRDSWQRPPLKIAQDVAAKSTDMGVRRECERIMVMLIERGARPIESYSSSKHDPAELDGRGNGTMIHWAAAMGMKDLVGACLNIGYPASLHTDEGVTPLHKAAEQGHRETVEFLLSKGADVNAKDRQGYRPRGRAVDNYHNDVAEILRKAGGLE